MAASTVGTQTTVCIECQVKYQANKVQKADGTILLTPPRCPTCQTAHLTNIRVNKTIKDFQLLGNLKARLTSAQRDAITDAIGNEYNTLLDRYAGSSVKSSAFDLKRIKG